MDSVFGGTPHYNAKSITTSGGTYNLTTDGNPRKENYNTDAKPGASTPYYEASGANNRTEDSTTIYDLPSNAKSYVEEEFDSGKKYVESTAHFSTFLVKQYPQLPSLNIVQHVIQLGVNWSFFNKDDNPKRTILDEGSKSITKLEPTPLKERFNEQFNEEAKKFL